jgi:hypothetical protein
MRTVVPTRAHDIRNPRRAGRLLAIGAAVSGLLVASLVATDTRTASATNGTSVSLVSTASNGGASNADSNPGQPDPADPSMTFYDTSHISDLLPGGQLAVFDTASDSSGFHTVTAIGGGLAEQVYAKNVHTGALTLLSTADPVLGSVSGTPGNGDSFSANISANGSEVVFSSRATNLGSAGSSTISQLFLVNLTTSPSITVQQITAGNSESVKGSIDDGGAYIDFQSFATNLVTSPVVPSSTSEIYRYNTINHTFSLLSESGGATPAAGDCPSYHFSSDANGGLVAIESIADNLLTGSGSGNCSTDTTNVYLKNVATGAVTQVNRYSTGQTLPSGFKASISADGGEVAFVSLQNATHAPGFNTGASQVYVRNIVANTTTLVSATTSGEPSGTATTGGSNDPFISPDGRYVVFDSTAPGLTSATVGSKPQVYKRDIISGTTTLISQCLPSVGGCPASGVSGGNGASQYPSISGDTSTVYFRSVATDLVSAATGGFANMYTFTSPGEVAFSGATTTVAYGAPSVTLSVDRSGGAVGTVSVHYQTINGTATADGDFTATSGTLTWTNGDLTPASITVPISTDAPPTPAGTTGTSFSVMLSSPLGGATVAVPGSETVTIKRVGTAPPIPQRTTLGYWLDASDGGVFTFGHAAFYGSTGGIHLNQPVVGMAATRDGHGYWLVASDGGIFSFGDAGFSGSTGGIHLNEPIVGMATDPVTGGYWLVASDGGIFSFNAPFYGSTGGIHLNQPVVGMAAAPDGNGYWLVARDGGIFSFGPGAKFYGSTGGIHLNQPVVGMAATSNGLGYWLDASDGGIFTFGDAAFYGSTGGIQLNKPMVGMAATSDGRGYWLDATDGGVFTFGDAPFDGSTGNVVLNKPMVGMAADVVTG